MCLENSMKDNNKGRPGATEAFTPKREQILSVVHFNEFTDK